MDGERSLKTWVREHSPLRSRHKPLPSLPHEVQANKRQPGAVISGNVPHKPISRIRSFLKLKQTSPSDQQPVQKPAKLRHRKSLPLDAYNRSPIRKQSQGGRGHQQHASADLHSLSKRISHLEAQLREARRELNMVVETSHEQSRDISTHTTIRSTTDGLRSHRHHNSEPFQQILENPVEPPPRHSQRPLRTRRSVSLVENPPPRLESSSARGLASRRSVSLVETSTTANSTPSTSFLVTASSPSMSIPGIHPTNTALNPHPPSGRPPGRGHRRTSSETNVTIIPHNRNKTLSAVTADSITTSTTTPAPLTATATPTQQLHTDTITIKTTASSANWTASTSPEEPTVPKRRHARPRALAPSASHKRRRRSAEPDPADGLIDLDVEADRGQAEQEQEERAPPSPRRRLVPDPFRLRRVEEEYEWDEEVF